jgi:hypothetical protein
MEKYRLKITREDFNELRQLVLANMPKEAGAFALAGISTCDNLVDILVRRPIKIPQSLMTIQNEYHLEESPQAINGLISLCESNKLGAVICHSHPKGLKYSPSDDYGEDRIARSLRQFVPTNAPIASLLFTPEEVTGRIWLPGKSSPVMLDEIIFIGDHLHRIINLKKKHEPITVQNLDLFDRQVRAFGQEGQKLVSQAKVGIIGIGGTGSPIAEQLVRLGVSDIILIDPDKFSPSNLTRVYGTTYNSVKKSKLFSEYKVNIISSYLKKINPKAQIQAINQNVVLSYVSRTLLDRDIIFLCTDEHWGRSIVNQISYQYLIPTINLGVRITSKNGVISDAIGVLDFLHPGKPCLWCKQFLRAEIIAAESMPANTGQDLLQEGYVEDVHSPKPSVISFTSSVASSAVSIFIHYFTNFMGESGNISRISYDFLTGLSSRGTTQIDTNCICQKVKGFGDLLSLPTVEHINNLP